MLRSLINPDNDQAKYKQILGANKHKQTSAPTLQVKFYVNQRLNWIVDCAVDKIQIRDSKILNSSMNKQE
ncbi:hypothetical protein GCM10011282_28840 [Undibacterium macrobrachii]|uniref:Uncharacterized protein n=1 Tax=Undibacterium macrobrachii TaxID=1119058 RepID=A0ABQ2XJK7_9BURK|nr:hypothetical protein GCM10011282_28840 [Undibacterium macrobrachii]